MSYEGKNYGSSHRRGGSGRYKEYENVHRDRSREYRQPIESRHRSDYKDNDRHYRENNRRTMHETRRRTSHTRREQYRESPERRSSKARPEAPRVSKVLGVFGLSTRTAEQDLYHIFSAYGRVRDIQMVFDNLTGRSRGFAFVYFDSSEDARNAKANCDEGLDIDGRMVRVDYSITKAPHPPTPGIYMGKFKRRPEFENDRYNRGRRDSRRDVRRRISPYESRRHRSRSRMSPPHNRYHSDRNNGGGNMRNRGRTMSSSRSRSPPPIFESIHGKNKLHDSPMRIHSHSASVVDSISPIAPNEKKDKVNNQNWIRNEGCESPV